MCEAIADSLQSIGGEYVDVLLDSLPDNIGAMKILGILKEERAVEPLLEMFKSGSRKNQILYIRRIVETLAEIGDLRAGMPLRHALLDRFKYEADFGHIIDALGKLGDHNAIEQLTRIVDETWGSYKAGGTIRKKAEQALRRILEKLRTGSEGANLEGVNLKGVYLEKANLRNANLQYAHLEEAILEGANLEGANLEGVSFDANTILPDGSLWTPKTDMARFTNPEHPNFWKLEEYQPSQHSDKSVLPAQQGIKDSISVQQGTAEAISETDPSACPQCKEKWDTLFCQNCGNTNWPIIMGIGFFGVFLIVVPALLLVPAAQAESDKVWAGLLLFFALWASVVGLGMLVVSGRTLFRQYKFKSQKP